MMNANSFDVKASQVPGKVEFYNFAELKVQMEQGLSVYKTTAYTTENISQAEKDLKELKAIKKKLTDKKKELETAYSMPIEEVRKQLDELINMVKEPLDYIDKMIKENNKQKKEQEILDYAAEKAAVLGEYADKTIHSKAFFNSRWLNATYKTKEWHEDVDKIIRDTADALQTISTVGGNNKPALMGYYFDHLSLDGADEFLKTVSENADDIAAVSEVAEDDGAVWYKVLKIFGTERQLLQLTTLLSLADYEFEEIEDGMPKSMEEIKVPDFDSFVAFDIEHSGTYGINKGDAESEIIEIGAVKVENGVIVDKFDMLANPGRKITPYVTKITGITNDMVQNERPLSEVIGKFKEFAGNSVLLGHNIISCDIPHIIRAAKKAGIAFDNQYFDTRKMAASLKKTKGWDKITLGALAAYYHIPMTNAHRAWCDAEVTAEVFLEMLKEK